MRSLVFVGFVVFIFFSIIIIIKKIPKLPQSGRETSEPAATAPAGPRRCHRHRASTQQPLPRNLIEINLKNESAGPAGHSHTAIPALRRCHRSHRPGINLPAKKPL